MYIKLYVGGSVSEKQAKTLLSYIEEDAKRGFYFKEFIASRSEDNRLLCHEFTVEDGEKYTHLKSDGYLLSQGIPFLKQYNNLGLYLLPGMSQAKTVPYHLSHLTVAELVSAAKKCSDITKLPLLVNSPNGWERLAAQEYLRGKDFLLSFLENVLPPNLTDFPEFTYTGRF